MKKICLVCSAGISAKTIVEKINNVLAQDNKEWKFEAITVNNLNTNDYDIVLLTPQVEYLKNKIIGMLPENKDIKVEVLPSDLYVKNDAKAIIDFTTNI
ncbi:PTS sugar transporter subunit IIB [Spiroplasma sp. DGKH1]|uniref:PTS sugar transporter subunit IIB n=1 Tax=Spiroplasma sp. DGKH1 TaxID=3050074 RepID=UPI0034C6220C